MTNFVDYQAQETIVSILKKNGTMKAAEIAAIVGHTVPAVTARLQAMAFAGKVKIIRQQGKHPALWTNIDEVQDPALPRTFTTIKQGFSGVDWGKSTMRPGCLDHLHHPSRRGNELVSHRTPILNASSTRAR